MNAEQMKNIAQTLSKLMEYEKKLKRQANAQMKKAREPKAVKRILAYQGKENDENNKEEQKKRKTTKGKGNQKTKRKGKQK